MLVKYVRKPRTEISKKTRSFRTVMTPVGVIVADVVNGELRLGWSKCCPRDKFDKEKGLEIAKARLYKCHTNPTRDMSEPVMFMYERAKKYFKC